MKIAINFNYRGQEMKVSQKGKDYKVLYLEAPDTGEAVKFFCLNPNKFAGLEKLQRDTEYTFIFELWSGSLFLEGVE